MRARPTVVALALGVVITATACSGETAGTGAVGSGAPSTTPATPSAAPTEKPTTEAPTESPTPETPDDPAERRALAEDAGANELGQVPVLMYHQFKKDTGGNRYDQTLAEFRKELRQLYDEGYYPVTARDFVTGEMDVPAGKHPVVLTFDDATVNQFYLDDDGEPEKETAMRVLLDFAADKPDFPATATFFVTGGAFASQPGALQWLVDNGFEVGNHSFGHTPFNTVDGAGVQDELARGAAYIAEETGVAPATLALPLGIRPDDEKLAVRGKSGGTSYEHLGVFLVGAHPSQSPFDKDFTPAGIPRIRSQQRPGEDLQWESGGWLQWLAEHPERRYTSDGMPEVVSFPEDLADEAAPSLGDRANAY